MNRTNTFECCVSKWNDVRFDASVTYISSYIGARFTDVRLSSSIQPIIPGHDFIWYGADWNFFWYPAAVMLFFALAWFIVGRDPEPGPLVARYEPPAMSPAEARYLLTGANDRKSIAAVLVHLDAQGLISLTPEPGGYFIRQLIAKAPANIFDDERAVFEKLFVSPAESEPLGSLHLQASSGMFSALSLAIRDALFQRLTRLYVTQNAGPVLGLALASIIAGLVIAANVQSRDGVVFLTLWFFLFTMMLGVITVMSVIPAWIDAIRGRLSLNNALKVTLPMVIFYGMPLFVAYIIGRQSQQGFAVSLVLVVIVVMVGGSVMKKPTPLGRQRLDEIAGYKCFVTSVDRDTMQRLNAPEAKPVVRGEELAWAIALDLKQSWGDRLADTMFNTTVTG